MLTLAGPVCAGWAPPPEKRGARETMTDTKSAARKTIVVLFIISLLKNT
jgi:hypothetical protein